MNEIIFLLPAFLACLVLTGIHTYLGIHVIARGVIFVDIALAQIAALGMTVAMLAGFELESQTAYFFGLGFTLLGATFFAFFREERLPEEALIGVSFAASSALAVLIADRIPHGSEHLKFILNGNILWVGWGEIVKTALIYSVLGYLHYRYQSQFLLVSHNPEQAQKEGLKIWLWDLFFYASFGIIITSSVQIGGILLVFSFLIVPALVSLLFYSDLRARLFLGWGVGLAVSMVGIALSYFGDFPTGAAIVTAFGLSLIVALGAKRLFLGIK